MKKKIIAIIVIMLLLGGGLYGYKYYKTVYLPSQEAKYDIEETTEVETKEVGTVEYTYDNSNSVEADEYFSKCFEIMKQNNAEYFIIDKTYNLFCFRFNINSYYKNYKTNQTHRSNNSNKSFK